MRFVYNGDTYVLEFERSHREVDVYKNGKKSTQPSKHPYTTARLIQLVPAAGAIGRKLVAQTTVGCVPTDPYSTAQGRLSALKSLTGVLRVLKEPKLLIGAVWQAYADRGKQPAKDGSIIEGVITRIEETQQKALPPASDTIH